MLNGNHMNKQTKAEAAPATEVSGLVDAAVTIAAHGARQYLERNKLTAKPDVLSACLSAWVKIKLPEALRDAKEALACHMEQVAQQTFAASMISAGIEAAKEASHSKLKTCAVLRAQDFGGGR